MTRFWHLLQDGGAKTALLKLEQSGVHKINGSMLNRGKHVNKSPHTTLQTLSARLNASSLLPQRSVMSLLYQRDMYTSVTSAKQFGKI
jgi:hypothetical protein